MAPMTRGQQRDRLVTTMRNAIDDTWSNGHVDLWQCVRDNPKRRQPCQQIDDACEYEVKHGAADSLSLWLCRFVLASSAGVRLSLALLLLFVELFIVAIVARTLGNRKSTS